MAQIALNGLTPLTTYYVQVRSRDVNGLYSEYSTLFPVATIGDGTVPSVVTGLAFAFVGGTAVATWTRPTTNADGTALADFKDYLVTITANGVTKTYYTTTERFEFTFDMNVSAFGTAQPILTIGVSARDTLAHAGTPVTATATNQRPATPAAPTVTPGFDSIKLQWAANTEADLAGYKITLNGTSNVVYQGINNSYEHVTVAYNTDHVFYLYAVDVFGQTSLNPVVTAAYRPNSAFTVDTTAPAATTLTMTAASTGTDKPAGIKFTWPAVTDTDLAGYHIRYSLNSTPRVWQYMDIGDKTATEATATGLQSQGSYVGQIRSYDKVTNPSAWSAEASGTASQSVIPMTNITTDIQIINSGILRSSNYVESTSTVPGTGWMLSPSLLNIEQGKVNARVVSAGQLQSNILITDSTKGTVGQPLWSLNLDGNMSINDAQVRGKIVVGGPSDTSAQKATHAIISSNYGGTGPQWSIKGDGTFDIKSGTGAGVTLSSAGLTATDGTNTTFNLTSAGALTLTGTLTGSLIYGSTYATTSTTSANAIRIGPSESFYGTAGVPAITFGAANSNYRPFIQYDSSTQDLLIGNQSSTYYTKLNVTKSGGFVFSGVDAESLAGETKYLTISGRGINFRGAFETGTQTSTYYHRTGNSFAWYKNGAYSPTYLDPGTGGTLLMKLDGNGNLTVPGTITYTGDAGGASGGIRPDNEYLHTTNDTQNVAGIKTFTGTLRLTGAALDVSNLSGTTVAASGTVGDKIALFNSGSGGYGIGIQASAFVNYIPSSASFVVRQASAAGNASSGSTTLFSVSGTGAVNTLGNLTENGARVYSANNPPPGTGVTSVAVVNNATVNQSTGAVTITNSLTPSFTSVAASGGITAASVDATGVIHGGGTAGDAFLIGNDVYLVDINSAYRFGVQGASDRTRGEIQLGNAGPILAGTSAAGTPLTITGNTIFSGTISSAAGAFTVDSAGNTKLGPEGFGGAAPPLQIGDRTIFYSAGSNGSWIVDNVWYNVSAAAFQARSAGTAPAGIFALQATGFGYYPMASTATPTAANVVANEPLTLYGPTISMGRLISHTTLNVNAITGQTADIFRVQLAGVDKIRLNATGTTLYLPDESVNATAILNGSIGLPKLSDSANKAIQLGALTFWNGFEFLPNGGFEIPEIVNGVNSTTKPFGWSLNNATWSNLGASALGGKYVIELSSAGNYSGITQEKRSAVIPGQQYIVRFSYKQTLGTLYSPMWRLHFFQLENSAQDYGGVNHTWVNAMSGYNSPYHTALNTWTTYTAIVTVPAGFYWMTAEVYLNEPVISGGTRTFLFDDMSVRRLIQSDDVAGVSVTKLLAGTINVDDIFMGSGGHMYIGPKTTSGVSNVELSYAGITGKTSGVTDFQLSRDGASNSIASWNFDAAQLSSTNGRVFINNTGYLIAYGGGTSSITGTTPYIIMDGRNGTQGFRIWNGTTNTFSADSSGNVAMSGSLSVGISPNWFRVDSATGNVWSGTAAFPANAAASKFAVDAAGTLWARSSTFDSVTIQGTSTLNGNVSFGGTLTGNGGTIVTAGTGSDRIVIAGGTAPSGSLFSGPSINYLRANDGFTMGYITATTDASGPVLEIAPGFWNLGLAGMIMHGNGSIDFRAYDETTGQGSGQALRITSSDVKAFGVSVSRGVVSKVAYTNGDYSGATAVATINHTGVSGRTYRVSASISGTQITAAGVPTVKLLYAGTEFSQQRILTGTSYAASTGVYGSGDFTYVSTGAAVAMSVQVQTSAGAFRITSHPLNYLIIEDIGA